MTFPNHVTITESSPRDGLQSLGVIIPTQDKASLIDDLAAAGLRSFDAVSFVNPQTMPQMADAAGVLASVNRVTGMVLCGLTPNLQGLERALAAGVDQIGLLTAASDTFSLRNTNSTVDASLDRIRQILDAAAGTELRTRAYISTVTDCPYEGPTDPRRVAELAVQLSVWGVDEIFLGETMGRGTPRRIETLLGLVLRDVPASRIGVHFHDTYGQAVANTLVALHHGVARMDASVAGLGGCPYAPGAAGNVATEDLVYLLNGLEIPSGVDLEALAAVGERFCRRHGLTHNSKAGQAVLAARAFETD
jgi:hydroxymethylglutaryl-CoA lyase